MSDIQKLLDIMARLRDRETGCPWDVEQDFASIAPYTIEEAYEVADAITRDDMCDLRNELGDLLLQVVFHARIAEEAELFDFGDVVEGIAEKMTRRHPHVFGTAEERAQGIEAGSWEAIKADERSGKGDNSVMAGIAQALPALMRAEKLGKRAGDVGFDWPDREGVREKIQEELGELEAAVGTRAEASMEEEFGDLLFAIVNMARHLKIDPEKALTGANHKFERRFRDMEREIADSGKRLRDFNLESLDKFWRKAKGRVG
ncbi:MAG TPA: nucleoside triphosphate pyrophosphohydrolase [Woeseiaceae bacterium]|nr:nucleoside triphosphate pyrophosphohydrolase [Woeseiaceae bacterium]